MEDQLSSVMYIQLFVFQFQVLLYIATLHAHVLYSLQTE